MADFTIHPSALHRWVVDLFAAAGSNATEARLAADHLVDANLTGHDSHGVGMIPKYVTALVNKKLQLNQTIEISNPSVTTYVVEQLAAGTWYFAVRAYTSAGNESSLSNVASKTIN